MLFKKTPRSSTGSREKASNCEVKCCSSTTYQQRLDEMDDGEGSNVAGMRHRVQAETERRVRGWSRHCVNVTAISFKSLKECGFEGQVL